MRIASRSCPSSRLWAAWLLVLAAACEGAHGEPPTDGAVPTIDAATSDAAVACGPFFDGAPVDDDRLIVGEREGDAFVSFEDDPQVLFQWGPQGGVMILPVIGVPLAVAGDDDCLEITLDHAPDPAAPEAFGDVGDFPPTTYQIAGEISEEAMWTEPLFDLIGERSLEGTRLLLEVTVRGRSFAVRETVALEVIAAGPLVCRELASTGDGGCAYRVIPGEGVLESIAPYEPPSGELACPDPRQIRVRFEPTDPETEVCYRDWIDEPVSDVRIGPYQLHPPSRCVAELTVGTRVPMELRVIEGGTCQPVVYELQLPGCEDACPAP